jgi:arachidonate 15-lipoxygenase
VNYPQYEYMSFVPNMPAGLYSAPWEGTEPVDSAAIMKMLPPPEQASLQIFTVKELTSFRHDRLGHYPAGSFPDEVLPIITRFQGALDRIGGTIREADAARRWKYPYLHPELILNSASI